MVLEALRRDGITYIPQTFPFSDVKSFLRDHLVTNAHVWAKGSDTDEYDAAVEMKQWPMFCHTMSAAVCAPHMFELAYGLLPIADAYFEEPALLYSMNVFWTQPAAGPQYQDTHGWHRDGDDRKQLVAFFMLTDVREDRDGLHMYQAGSHNAETDAIDHNKWVRLLGNAGSVFLEDTRGLHVGARPQKLRGLGWARFGVSNPPESYKWDKLSPVPARMLGDRYPADPAIQKAIALVVR